MIKTKYMKPPAIYVVIFLGVLAVAGGANAEEVNTISQDESIDSIVDSTQQRIADLSEKLQNFQIQAEREKNLQKQLQEKLI